MECPRCGHQLSVVEQRSPVKRAWVWFNHGPPVWQRRFRCQSGAFLGTDRSFSALTRPTSSLGIWRRWRQFQFSRRILPVPRFYVILAATGAAVGAGLRLTVKWPWWILAVALTVAGWIWAASSAIPRR